MEQDSASNTPNLSDSKLESNVTNDDPISTPAELEQAPAPAPTPASAADETEIVSANASTNDSHSSPDQIKSNSFNIQDGNSTDASTEVLFDQTISERLAKLNLVNDSPDNLDPPTPTNSQQDPPAQPNNSAKSSESATPIKESYENSTKDGYISLSHQDDHDDAATNNSEQSVKIDRDGSSDDDYVEDKDGSVEYNQEMSIEDPEEDVEEEEEFHEVEEDKHKLTENDKTEASKSNSSPVAKIQVKTFDNNDSIQTARVADDEPDQAIEDANKEEKSPIIEKPESKDWAAIMSSTDKEVDSSEAVGKDSDEVKDEDGRKELDHDEDVNNPQYVPKKGMFYEHDDRGGDIKKPVLAERKKDDVDSVEKKDVSTKKPASSERQGDRRGRRQRTDNDRWNHDRYKDEKQKPKNRRDVNSQSGYERSGRNRSRDINDQRTQKSGISERIALNQDNRSKRGGRGGRDVKGDRGERNNRSGDRRGVRRQDQVKRDQPNRIFSKSETSVQAAKPDQLQSEKQSPQQSQIYTRKDHVADVREFRDKGAATGWGKRIDYNGDKNQAIIPNPMQHITTWSNKMEENLKNDEASRKEQSSLSSYQQHPKGRSNDLRQTMNRSSNYNDRSRQDDRTKTYHSRNRYQDRDDSMKMQSMNKQNYGDRPNQHQPNDSHGFNRRMLQYTHTKSNDCDEPIKTQTYENSRLSQQSNLSRNFKDAREIINEKRMQQQLLPMKISQPRTSSNVSDQMQNRPVVVNNSLGDGTLEPMPNSESLSGDSLNSRPIIKANPLIYTKEFTDRQRAYANANVNHGMSSVNVLNSGNIKNNSSSPASLDNKIQKGDDISSSLQSRQIRQNTLPNQQTPTVGGQLADNKFVPSIGLKGPALQQHQPISANAQHHSNNRNGPFGSGSGLHYQASRQQIDPLQGPVQDIDDHRRQLSHHSSSASNSHPIQQASVSVAGHSQPQHSHSHHRLMSSHMSQQNTTTVGSHIGQYYNTAPNSNSREQAAALASAAAYGYMAGAQPMVDASRYHMASQLSYMGSGQTNDVSASVLHQGMYPDTTPGAGSAAGSGYMASASNLSSSSIPVTGTGPPLGAVLGSGPPHAPASYLQHSQYPPSPYSSHHYQQSQPGQGPQPGAYGHAPPSYGMAPGHPTHPNSMQAQPMASEEMYRLQSMTFYDPSTQHTSHRQLPSRRQKAALDMDPVGAQYGQDPATEYSY